MRRAIPVLIVLGVGVVSALPKVLGTVPWVGTDAIFYQAQSLEVRGDSQAHALAVVMVGTPGRSALATDRRLFPKTARQLASARWRSYSARFYRRRWVVPALTALVSPTFGEQSLLLVAGLGYVVAGLLLYFLLARRFAVGISVVVTAIFLVSWPMRVDALGRTTDSWGLALLVLALLCGLWVLERGLKWLPLWILALVVLSITREDGVVALVAAVWLALRMRTVRAGALAAGSVLATLPASLLLGAPLQVSLAYVENGYNPPPDTSWSYVIGHYWPAVRYTLREDLTFPQAQGFSIPSSLLWYAGMVVLLGGVVLLVRAGPDPYFRLIRATLIGAVLYIAISVNYTNLRLELVFVPALAVSLALVAQLAIARTTWSERWREWLSPPPAPGRRNPADRYAG